MNQVMHAHSGHGDHGDHGEHEGHEGHNEGEMGCSMIMYFHSGHCERILWDGWTATTELQFVFSALGIFVIAFAYEALKYARESFYYKVSEAERSKSILNEQAAGSNGTCCSSAPIVQKSIIQKMFNRPHLIQSLLHLLQITISYLLMLIVMTFNYWLCLAVILGAAVGYFCFGWIRQQAIDINEHCH